MIVSAVLAVSENGVIGKDNQLPWRLPADLKYFKRTTIDHTVIMGRKTYDSIGRPLPRRRNLVITRNRDWTADGVEVVHGLTEAIAACAGESEVFIIGGATIYERAFAEGLVTRLHLTQVHADFAGDTFFTLPEADTWRVISQVRHESDEKNPYAYSFLVLER
ncbi:MAG: dihydrofolate reductase [Bacteroidota bacterium]